MATRTKRKASVPAWESSSTRAMADYLQKSQAQNYGTFEELKPLLEKYLNSPSSLGYSQEDELDKRLMLMTHLPNTDPQKLDVIFFCGSSPHGKSIIKYLLDPEKVGIAR